MGPAKKWSMIETAKAASLMTRAHKAEEALAILADAATLRDALACLPGPDEAAVAAARARQDQLTKPKGALGLLEELAIWLAGWQGWPVPVLDKVQILVCTGWHGIAEAGYSAYPAAVTAQMQANFEAGGAAINQLARAAGADLSLLPLFPGEPTASFADGPAMSPNRCLEAMRQGFAAVDPAAGLLILGEMGIGNTSSAAAICALLFDEEGALWAGPGTGLDPAGVARKAALLDKVRARRPARDPLDVLAEVGGHEIAAMLGAMVAARLARIPVLLDGFVVCAAAALLQALDGEALAGMQAAHLSAEPAHARLLAKLGLEPVLALGMRLGEGSGAAVALSVLRAALACHAGMATFAEAGVSTSKG